MRSNKQWTLCSLNQTYVLRPNRLALIPNHINHSADYADTPIGLSARRFHASPDLCRGAWLVRADGGNLKFSGQLKQLGSKTACVWEDAARLVATGVAAPEEKRYGHVMNVASSRWKAMGELAASDMVCPFSSTPVYVLVWRYRRDTFHFPHPN